MFTEGIFPIGDGMLDIDEERLKRLLVPDDINEIYDVEQTPFARGKFAAVRRAVHKNSGVHFAAKFLKRRRRAQSSDKEIKHEIAVLMLCDGADNIVKLNAVHESRSDTALLLELATGGELQTFLDNEECLSEAQARICMREVLRALQFLHKRSIAHLDLKPQNILLSGERIEDGLKLCDFGISRVVAEGTNVREIVGTPDYVAPEVLQYEPLSLLTDIWSVGVLAYVLLSGFSPFGGETKQETFLNISQCALTFPDKLFGGVSAAAIDFIRRALRIKPNDRMTAAGCLEHIWLKDECSIDRQILSADIAKKATAAAGAPEDEHDVDLDVDVDIDVDVDDADVDDDDDGADGETENDMAHDEGDESVEEDEEEDEEDDDDDDDDDISIRDNNGQQNGSNKMDSSNTEEESQSQIATNGKATHNKGSHGSNNGINGTTTSTKYNSNGTKSASHGKTSHTNTTTTAYVTVPAMRATTIPLQFRMMQQQPLLHHYTPLAARRHSSADSNKENKFLATKKIVPVAASGNVVKKPSALATSTVATTTATIIIAPSEMATAPANSVVATITLPNGSHNGHSSGGSGSSNGASLFPDAPTTPKVIRKAPTTDTSPTSVKALVKKFQLEGGSNAQKYMLHLKEAQVNHQQQQQQQLHQQQPPQLPHSNGLSGSTKKSPIAANGKIGHKSLDQCSAAVANGEQTKKCGMVNGNGRRSSEPLTAVHHKLLSSSLPSPTLSTASAPVTSYKSTCVFCTTCGSVTANNSSSSSSSANGCRHSMAGNHLSNSAKVSNNNSSSSSSSNSTKNSTAASNGSSSRPSAAAALLLSSHHQQLQHHHHHTHQIATHHHLVAKGAAANNLSLDQGIIC